MPFVKMSSSVVFLFLGRLGGTVDVVMAVL